MIKRIVEVVYNYPYEVFIQRHLWALKDQSFYPDVVARHSDERIANLSSIGQKKLPAEIMPNFDRMNFAQKFASLSYLLRNFDFSYTRTKLRNNILISYFSSMKPILMHFHFGSLAVLMDWIPQTLGIPYSLSLRGSDIQVLPLMSQDYKDKLRNCLLNANGIHTVCNSIWIDACELCEFDPCSRIHRTIYTTVPICEKPYCNESKIEKNKPYHFISIGRFHWRKSFINLLLAFNKFLGEVSPAHLTIVGDGHEKEAIIYWINDLELTEHVSLTGKLQYNDISMLLRDCDGLVQSSIAEGFSNVTAEAMGLGVPVFATDVGGTGEIIIDGENGFLLDPHKPFDWWQKLQLIKDRALMEKIGHNGWVTAKETFSAEIHAKEFIKFYQNVIND